MTFISTPSHGYLEIPIVDFIKFYKALPEKDLDSIGYGYCTDKFAYLEEDCEAELFINQMNIDRSTICDQYSESFDEARRYGGLWQDQPLNSLSVLTPGLREDLNTMTDTITLEQAWDRLLELGISKETLRTVTNINGYSLETLQDILYSDFGYHSFDQFESEE